MRKYDLYLTLYPSFITTMFVPFKRDEWVKRFGYCQGVRIRQEGDGVWYEGNCDESYVKLLTGLWFEPWNYLHEVERKYLEIIERLIEKFACIRLAISPYDHERIFISTFLSRVTGYYQNVIRWVQGLLELTGDRPERIDENVVRRVGNSFQLIQLSDALRAYLARVKPLVEARISFWKIRQELLGVKYVGPKVADAFLIFTGLTTELAPSDRHYINFVKKLGLFERFRQPEKRLCISYRCPECLHVGICLTGLSHMSFGRLSSWVQTVAYVADSLGLMTGIR